MSKKLFLLVGVLFLFVAIGSAFGQTEDEIVARYMKKAQSKQKTKVGFFSANFSYGVLAIDNGYNNFASYADSRISPGNPIGGIWRTNQLGANFGLMMSSRTALKFGFEYWLQMGVDKTGDYVLGIEPLGTQTDFNLISQVQIYGFTGGADYYLLNPPDRNGVFHSLALRVGANGGYYMANWEVWEGLTTYNLVTANFEANNDPLKDNTIGFSVSAGVDYPTPVFDLLLGADISYQYLNFDNVKSYNSVDEELYLSYSDTGTDRVDLDFSGLRGKIELKRFFNW